MKARSSRIRIRGAWWKIKHCRPPGKEALDGLCDYDTRTIYVNPKAIEQQGTLIHEVLHAAGSANQYTYVGELSFHCGLYGRRLTLLASC